MRLRDLKLATKEIITKTRHTPLIIGEKGIGKSEVMQQLFFELFTPDIPYSKEKLQELQAEHKAPVQSLYLSLMPPEDIQGIPFRPSPDANFFSFGDMDLLPTIRNVEWRKLFPPRGGIIFEELNRASRDTQNSVLELILNNQVHNHVIHPGWRHKVALVNPSREGYTVQEMDEALLGRFVILTATPDANDWIQYQMNRWDEPQALSVLEFIGMNPEHLNAEAPPIDLGFIKPDPRRWERAMDILTKCSLPQGIMEEVIAGCIGPSMAASYFKWLADRSRNPVKGEEILTNYEQVRPKIRSQLGQGAFDLINVTMHDLIREIKNAMRFGKLDASEIARRIEPFCQDLPKEKFMMFARMLWENGDEFRQILFKMRNATLEQYNAWSQAVEAVR